ncbi:asparagine synthase (glutamine-hydrolyzing) [Embleya sp. AB8]|uniref:asparagine synthase (glutamine-hydrolyzing) n=1 Tax=Embleya sp. AB8 TaxID=3156304 RepID=UPI003C77F25D
MCGITGWISFDRDLSAERKIVDAMTETMSHRGPDDRDTWVQGPAALGHCRLAVIDLPGGRQPMTAHKSDGSPVVIVYSGETYNHLELRTELVAKGHCFNTDSDTEVVLRGYLEWGEAVAERLNGMAAFAIWDEEFRRLVMIRDRMGIKPLYYHPTPDGVLFGSEPKAILANPLARREVGADGIRELLAFVKTPGHAIWAGMYEIEPGTVVTVDRGGLRRHVYWSLRTRPHVHDRDTSIMQVRTLLEDIVHRQLVSDVPRSILLSGGLDSSAITALAARRLGEAGESVRSFSVDFVGRTENFVADALHAAPDAAFVQDVARRSGTDHRDIVLDSAALADPAVRASVIRARDIPMGMGDLDTSLHLLFKAIREHSTVALSGEAADEVFGGYQAFFDENVRRADTFPWIVRHEDNFGDSRDILAPGVADSLDLDSYLRDGYRTALGEVERLDGERDFEFRMREICYLHLTRFVRILLDRKDRTSMAVGLEVRVPFCDHRLVEYVYNAPWSLKSFDGREKSLLREATADVLPRSVYDRVKSPYPATQDPRYVSALQDQAKDLLSAPAHPVFDLVDRRRLRRIANHEAPRITRAHRHGLERTLDLAVWLDIYAPTLTL